MRVVKSTLHNKGRAKSPCRDCNALAELGFQPYLMADCLNILWHGDAPIMRGPWRLFRGVSKTRMTQ
jgi:hypothetical protein